MEIGEATVLIKTTRYTIKNCPLASRAKTPYSIRKTTRRIYIHIRKRRCPTIFPSGQLFVSMNGLLINSVVMPNSSLDYVIVKKNIIFILLDQWLSLFNMKTTLRFTDSPDDV
jgi:hypothetical protein